LRRLGKKPNIGVVRPPASAMALFLVTAACDPYASPLGMGMPYLELFTKPPKFEFFTSLSTVGALIQGGS